MEITGNIKLILDTETGTSKAGKEWAKRQLVVTTTEQYPQDIAIDFLGDKITQLNKFQVGNPVTVSINIRGNEYNGKYYNSINGWKVANHIGNVSNSQQQPAREETADLPF
jgi:glucan biosynthesis protein